MKCDNCDFNSNEEVKFCPLCGGTMAVGNVIASVDATASGIESIRIFPNQSINYGSEQDNNVQNNVPVNNIPVNNYAVNNQQQYATVPSQNIKNYLTLNIVFLVLNAITVCMCCGEGVLFVLSLLIVLGALAVSIVGVVISQSVNKKLALGDIEGALKASKSAKTLFLIAMILFISKFVIVIVSLIYGMLVNKLSPQDMYQQFMDEYQKALDRQNMR